MTNFKDLNAGDQQTITRRLVDQNVLINVSLVVAKLLSVLDTDANDDRDTLMSITQTEDCEQTGLDYITNWSTDNLLEHLKGKGVGDTALLGEMSDEELRDLMGDVIGNDWLDFCEEYDIAPTYIEALEFWAVNDWLADHLISRGEMVAKDLHGLNIWGRTCSGQAILLDSVINKICEDLNWTE